MRLYLDQMFRAELAEILRSEGHDVVRAEEVGQARADDAEILERACAEGRILITLDKHFGDWVILPLSKHRGVIRLKIHPTTTQNAAALLLPFLRGQSQEKFRNHLVVVSSHRVKWVQTA